MDLRILTILLIVLPILGAGILLAVQAWRAEQMCRAARDWSQTSGTVIASDLQGIGGGVPHPVDLTKRRFSARIVYEYEVDGVRYQSQRLSTGEIGRASDGDRAWQAAARFPAGRQVTVYYNPCNPAQAALERGASLTAWILWLASALTLALAGVLAGFVLSLPY